MVLGFTAAQLAVAAIAAPVGAMLHELTHAVTARLLGASTRLSLLELHVDYAFDEPAPNWKHRLVLLSPGITGLVWGSAAVLSGVDVGRWWLALALGWLFYTVSFRLEDYCLRAARGDEHPFTGEKNKAALRGFVIVLAGSVALLGMDAAPAKWQMLLWMIGYSAMLGGAGGMFLELHHLGAFDGGRDEDTRAGA